MRLEKAIDFMVRKNLAEIVVIGILGAPTHALVDSLSPFSCEHSHGAGMHDASHTGAVRLREQLCCSADIRVVKLFPVPSAFVAVAEKRRGVEHHVIPLQMCGELADIRDVASHDLYGEISKLPFCLCLLAAELLHLHVARHQ